MKHILTELKPGDKFIYNNTEYMLINFDLAGIFMNRAFTELLCALDLNTYKVIGLYKDWEVEVLSYIP